MRLSQPESFFAPPDRQNKDTLEKQHKEIVLQPLIKDVLDSLPYAAVLLNQERQVVFSNSTLLSMLGLSDPGEYLGQRPGEIFHCIHAREHPSGCGTSRHCRVCGAVRVILASQKQNTNIKGECRITSEISGERVSFDLMISSTPVFIGKHRFFIVNMIDISHEKRRRMLERIFFHDIINNAGNILTVSQLASRKPERSGEMIPLLLSASEQLIDDINAQKKLLDAENNELVLNFQNIRTMECLKFTITAYHEFAADRNIKIQMDTGSEDIPFECDKSLLLRVLGNMLKNAIEAEDAGEVVTTGCRHNNGKVLFWCHNPQYMSEEVRMQVFQRSFTTKGTGRGLGTYIIKLFSEKYLKGKAAFSSSEQGGTTFTVTLPLSA